jgi:hypothetical protein
VRMRDGRIEGTEPGGGASAASGAVASTAQ